jgi:hypothetical protein
MRNVSDKFVEKIKTHFLSAITLFFEIRVVFEIMWKDTVEPGRAQMAIKMAHMHCMLNKNYYRHTQKK